MAPFQHKRKPLLKLKFEEEKWKLQKHDLNIMLEEDNKLIILISIIIKLDMYRVFFLSDENKK